MKQKQESRLIVRIIMSLVGFFICGFGIALAAKTDLGLSPFTSFPYVVSLVGERTLGFYVACTYLFCLLLQFLILRKDFKPTACLQILSSVICGYFVDVWEIVISALVFPNYFTRLIGLVGSILTLALGVVFYVEPQMMPMPTEGLVLAISQKLKMPFGTAKVLHDSSFTVAACVLSFLLLGQLKGVREGTILTALFLGRVIAILKKRLSPPLHKLCFGEEKASVGTWKRIKHSLRHLKAAGCVIFMHQRQTRISSAEVPPVCLRWIPAAS